jgi:hypothetical protein
LGLGDKHETPRATLNRKICCNRSRVHRVYSIHGASPVNGFFAVELIREVLSQTLPAGYATGMRRNAGFRRKQ